MSTAAERTARIAEINIEIAEINASIKYIRKAGQSYTMMTSAGGGTQRMTTNAALKELNDQRNELRAELKSLQGGSAFRVRASW
jgi:prefoldin subunit 5